MEDEGYWTPPIILTLWTELYFRRVSKLRKATIKVKKIKVAL